MREDNANLRAGLVASVIVNLFRDASTPPVLPGDFFTPAPPPEPEDPERLWKRQLQIVEVLSAVFGCELKKGRPDE